MFNLLKLLRYFVFFVFVICSAIITSVAVWNLSIVESIGLDSTAKQIDIYLISVGASGLLLIFPLIFFELYGKDVFLGRVWFELLWVGLFWIMYLAGAAAITAHSSSQTCNLTTGTITIFSESPCASIQVLQAFTWICAILLLGYLTLLSILSVVKQSEDPTIWHCSVRRFPWMNGLHTLNSAPTSPSLPRFHSQTPVIVAPRPRRIAALRDAIRSYRSGLSSEYEIEPYQPPAGPIPAREVLVDRPIPPVPAEIASQPPQIRQSTQQMHQTQQPVFSSPFYHTSVQTAIDNRPQPPPPAQRAQIRRLPPSPPPLGNWPRLDATARPRTKRKPLPQPQHPPQTRTQAIPSSSRDGVDASALAAALQPLATPSSPTRSKPTGPRRRTSSDDYRPPHLDLSNISSIRSAGFI